MSNQYSVEIDCGPGMVRPNTYFDNMCNTCGLDPIWFDVPSTCFGCWEWKIKPEYEDSYKAKYQLVETFLTKLYKSGAIRYASF